MHKIRFMRKCIMNYPNLNKWIHGNAERNKQNLQPISRIENVSKVSNFSDARVLVMTYLLIGNTFASISHYSSGKNYSHCNGKQT